MTPAELRTARNRLGLTQKGLAERLQMGTHGWQSISKWESDSNERGVPGPVSVAIGYMLEAHARNASRDSDTHPKDGNGAAGSVEDESAGR